MDRRELKKFGFELELMGNKSEFLFNLLMNEEDNMYLLDRSIKIKAYQPGVIVSSEFIKESYCNIGRENRINPSEYTFLRFRVKVDLDKLNPHLPIIVSERKIGRYLTIDSFSERVLNLDRDDEYFIDSSASINIKDVMTKELMEIISERVSNTREIMEKHLPLRCQPLTVLTVPNSDLLTNLTKRSVLFDSEYIYMTDFSTDTFEFSIVLC